MDEVLKVVVLGRSARNASNIKNRQPLSKMLISVDTLPDYYGNIVKEELNVKDIVYKRQGGICPLCGEVIDAEHPGSAHHRSYKYAGMGGEIEAQDVVYIHSEEHISIHRNKKSYIKYSILNDRNRPVDENHSDLAEAIRKERESYKKK